MWKAFKSLVDRYTSHFTSYDIPFPMKPIPNWQISEDLSVGRLSVIRNPKNFEWWEFTVCVLRPNSYNSNHFQDNPYVRTYVSIKKNFHYRFSRRNVYVPCRVVDCRLSGCNSSKCPITRKVWILSYAMVSSKAINLIDIKRSPNMTWCPGTHFNFTLWWFIRSSEWCNRNLNTIEFNALIEQYSWDRKRKQSE